MRLPYTITDSDEARNRALQVQAHVERQLRGDPEYPAPANHAPLASIEVARKRIALEQSLAGYRDRHPDSSCEPAQPVLSDPPPGQCHYCTNQAMPNNVLCSWCYRDAKGPFEFSRSED